MVAIIRERQKVPNSFVINKGDGEVCGRKVLKWPEVKDVNGENVNPKTFSADHYIGVCWIGDYSTPVFILPKLIGMSFSRMYSDCMGHVYDKEYGRWFESKLAWFDYGKPGVPLAILGEAERWCLREFMAFAVLDFVAKVRVCRKGRIFSFPSRERYIIERACRDAVWYAGTYGLRLPDDVLYELEDLSMELKCEKRDRLLKAESLIELCFSEDSLMSAAAGVISVCRSLNAKCFPVMAIDADRLFELYIFHKLDSYRDFYGRKDILYQEKIEIPSGKKSPGHWYPDFLWCSRGLVMDAKNKSLNVGCPGPDDLRQLAGYGRSSRVHELLDVLEGQEPRILFVYPDFDGVEAFGADVISQSEKLEGFTQMYTLKLKVPRTEY